MMNNTQLVARGWVMYAFHNKLKAGTKKYEQAHHAFLLGALALLAEKAPPILTIYAMTGRDIADLDNSMDEEQATA
jgi:hypothetical protein